MAGFNLGKARDILKGLASFAWGKVVGKVAGYFVTAGQQIVQKLPEPVADFSELGLAPESIRTLVALRDKGYNARVTQDQLRALWNDLLKPGAKSSWIYAEKKQTLFAQKRPLHIIADQLIQGQPVSVGELTRLLERGGRGIVNPRFPLPRPGKVADTAPASQYPPHLGQPVMGKGWFIRLLPTDLINTIFKPVVWVLKLPVRAVENIAKLPILPLILTRTVESSRWNGMFSFNTIARGAIAATMYATVASAVSNANSEPPQPLSEHPTISQPAASTVPLQDTGRQTAEPAAPIEGSSSQGKQGRQNADPEAARRALDVLRKMKVGASNNQASSPYAPLVCMSVDWRQAVTAGNGRTVDLTAVWGTANSPVLGKNAGHSQQFAMHQDYRYA